MRIACTLLCLLLCLGPNCFARQPKSSGEIVRYVERYLPHQGTLKRAGSFVYVDLDDAYIHKLILLIDEEGFEEPPYFGWCERAVAIGRHVDGVGAHKRWEFTRLERRSPFGHSNATSCGRQGLGGGR